MISWGNMFPEGVWLDGNWIIVAVLILILIHLIALPAKYKRTLPQLILGLGIGVMGCVLFSDYIFSSLGWVQKGGLAPERYYSPQDIKGHPVVLIVGSSYTDIGLNPDVVNAELERRGSRTRVMVRAAGGASRFEQWQFVSEALEVLDSTPVAVLYEVSLSYDHRPVYGLKSPFSERALSQFDWNGAKWTIDALLSDDEYKLKGLEDKVDVSLALSQHFLVSRLNIGFAHKMTSVDKLRLRPSHSPRMKAERTYEPTKQAENLKPAIWELNPSKLPKVEINPWVSRYYADVERMLKERGVEVFGFFAMPTGSTGRRRYTLTFCQEKNDYVCLNGNNRPLITRLTPEHWIDTTHLRTTGAEIYSKWLAGELIEQGLAK